MSDIGAWELLEMVAGERCPCGHAKAEHDEPQDDEVMGACRDCECLGLLDAGDYDDDE